ncbi:MAG: hypothetical protein MAG795_00627 [Candidatus Woesearchaeota archaeon]|nr:hypothetical protein [Candidatus Woesearchaeota archaeon]
MKKGLIFTLDATLAIIVAAALILSIMFYISKINVPTQNHDLHRRLRDSLIVLEKNKVLKNSVLNPSSTDLQDFLVSLPANSCAKIEILNQNNLVVKTATKTSCDQPEEYLVVRRVFIANNQAYIAKMVGWYT